MVVCVFCLRRSGRVGGIRVCVGGILLRPGVKKKKEMGWLEIAR